MAHGITRDHISEDLPNPGQIESGEIIMAPETFDAMLKQSAESYLCQDRCAARLASAGKLCDLAMAETYSEAVKACPDCDETWQWWEVLGVAGGSTALGIVIGALVYGVAR